MVCIWFNFDLQLIIFLFCLKVYNNIYCLQRHIFQDIDPTKKEMTYNKNI